jgi:hypothetical protein
MRCRRWTTVTWRSISSHEESYPLVTTNLSPARAYAATAGAEAGAVEAEPEVDERDVALEAAIREFNDLQAKPGATVSRSGTITAGW